MLIINGLEWKYACFGLKPSGNVFVVMFILNGFEWNTVQQIVGTMFKPFLLSISSFLDTILVQSICVLRNITVGNSWQMLQSG